MSSDDKEGPRGGIPYRDHLFGDDDEPEGIPSRDELFEMIDLPGAPEGVPFSPEDEVEEVKEVAASADPGNTALAMQPPTGITGWVFLPGSYATYLRDPLGGGPSGMPSRRCKEILEELEQIKNDAGDGVSFRDMLPERALRFSHPSHHDDNAWRIVDFAFWGIWCVVMPYVESGSWPAGFISVIYRRFGPLQFAVAHLPFHYEKVARQSKSERDFIDADPTFSLVSRVAAKVMDRLNENVWRPVIDAARGLDVRTVCEPYQVAGAMALQYVRHALQLDHVGGLLEHELQRIESLLGRYLAVRDDMMDVSDRKLEEILRETGPISVPLPQAEAEWRIVDHDRGADAIKRSIDRQILDELQERDGLRERVEQSRPDAEGDGEPDDLREAEWKGEGVEGIQMPDHVDRSRGAEAIESDLDDHVERRLQNEIDRLRSEEKGERSALITGARKGHSPGKALQNLSERPLTPRERTKWLVQNAIEGGFEGPIWDLGEALKAVRSKLLAHDTWGALRSREDFERAIYDMLLNEFPDSMDPDKRRSLDWLVSSLFERTIPLPLEPDPFHTEGEPSEVVEGYIDVEKHFIYDLDEWREEIGDKIVEVVEHDPDPPNLLAVEASELPNGVPRDDGDREGGEAERSALITGDRGSLKVEDAIESLQGGPLTKRQRVECLVGGALRGHFEGPLTKFGRALDAAHDKFFDDVYDHFDRIPNRHLLKLMVHKRLRLEMMENVVSEDVEEWKAVEWLLDAMSGGLVPLPISPDEPPFEGGSPGMTDDTDRFQNESLDDIGEWKDEVADTIVGLMMDVDDPPNLLELGLSQPIDLESRHEDAGEEEREHRRRMEEWIMERFSEEAISKTVTGFETFERAERAKRMTQDLQDRLFKAFAHEALRQLGGRMGKSAFRRYISKAIGTSLMMGDHEGDDVDELIFRVAKDLYEYIDEKIPLESEMFLPPLAKDDPDMDLRIMIHRELEKEGEEFQKFIDSEPVEESRDDQGRSHGSDGGPRTGEEEVESHDSEEDAMTEEKRMSKDPTQKFLDDVQDASRRGVEGPLVNEAADALLDTIERNAPESEFFESLMSDNLTREGIKGLTALGINWMCHTQPDKVPQRPKIQYLSKVVLEESVRGVAGPGLSSLREFLEDFAEEVEEISIPEGELPEGEPDAREADYEEAGEEFTRENAVGEPVREPKNG